MIKIHTRFFAERIKKFFNALEIVSIYDNIITEMNIFRV